MTGSPRPAARPAPTPLSGVLFDLDGVLVDSARAWHRVVQRGAARYGCPPVPWEAFRPTFGQGPEGDQRSFFPGVAVDEVARFYDETFPEELDALEVMQGGLALLADLARRGLARGVVTNTPAPLAREVLRRTGILPHLDAFAGATEAAEKPAPDLIYLVLERLALAPGQVVYVGDSDSDRAAAAAANVYLVGFRRPGDARIEHLTDLVGWLDAAR
jgi:HAD superfamily hydrolase (TIGR01549 family)